MAGVVDGCRQLNEAEMAFAFGDLGGAAGFAAANLQRQPQRGIFLELTAVCDWKGLL